MLTNSTARFVRRLFLSTGLLALVSAGVAYGSDEGKGKDNEDSQGYLQTNLVSDLSGMAQQPPDSDLVNPWGLTRGPSTPWWISDNGMGVSTLYDGTGAKLALRVVVPPPLTGNPPSTPTAVVSAIGTAFNPVRFIFVTEDGTISAWSSGTNAVLKVDHAGAAVYKGAAIGTNSSNAEQLYVANFFSGLVEVYDTSFGPVSLPAGAFTDPEVPEGFAPFNVRNIGGNLFVCYAKQDDKKHDDVAGAGFGWVSVFDGDGTFLGRLRHGPWMNSPWGVTMAPDNFGHFSGRLLVGNFGSGAIAAFHAKSWNFVGLLRDAKGKEVVIDGLWGLEFGNGSFSSPTNSLYFTAGIQGEAHGLFGTLTVAPKPEAEKEE